MEPLDILYADNLDLLFENRNKSYGAYPLRKYYARRLFSAMGTVLGMVLIFSCAILFFKTKEGISGRILSLPDTYLTSAILEPPVIKEPVMARSAAPVKHVAVVVFTNPLIVQNQPVPKPMAGVDELKESAIGIHAEAGLTPTGNPDERGGLSVGVGNGVADSIEKTPEIYDHVQVMPEFPGGLEALKRFLLKNLRMPDTGLDPGSQVRVIAKFVVGPDGKVSGIKMIQSGGRVYDEEVQRVISKMPDWKPGIQNRKKVSVYFNLPVNFMAAPEN